MNSKHFRRIALFFSTLLISSSAFAVITPQEANNIQWLKSFFKEIFETPNSNLKSIVPQRVSKDYVQHVDGKTIGYQDFMKHLIAQRKVISNMKIRFEHIVADGDKVSTIHWVTAKKKNGEEILAKVVAMFEIKGNKLVMVDELTHLVKGSKEDADLGSRH